MLRAIKHWWQRRTRGWDDSDTWSLDGTIAEFVLPRLKRFKKLNNGYPHSMTFKEWESKIDDMIYALEICVKEMDDVITDADWPRVERGLQSFGKHFRNLWW